MQWGRITSYIGVMGRALSTYCLASVRRSCAASISLISSSVYSVFSFSPFCIPWRDIAREPSSRAKLLDALISFQPARSKS